MNAFGREVASRTVAGVLSGLILAGLAAVWGFVKVFGPSITTHYHIEVRELTAWALVTLLALVTLALLASLLKQTAATSTPREKPKPSSVELTLNNGIKPSVTLTHHGGTTTYHVDGQIIALIDGSPNPWPTRFQCQIQKSGITGGWEMALNEGEWANVIFGSVEPTIGSDSMGNRFPIGDHLVIRRGKQGQHVEVPDAGAIVELRIRTAPSLAQAVPPKRYRIVKQDEIATVSEEH